MQYWEHNSFIYLNDGVNTMMALMTPIYSFAPSPQTMQIYVIQWTLETPHSTMI